VFIEGGMTVKVGIVGKGGVGKTTIAALLAGAYSDMGRRVLAIDTDSNPNLGISLGLSVEEAEAVPVIPRSLVIGSAGGMTPEGLISEYGRQTPGGVRLLSAMRVTQAGAG
jgi:CO dehydrogenase maturation factor